MSNLLSNLNTEQYKAVTLPDESALILAGAGSGKTRVLITRIAYLIEQRRVSPAGVLAVTFTNKAAREMTTRLSAMLPIDTRGMWIGTFHGLCNRFLRMHHREAGLPNAFQILDTADQLSAIKRLLKTNNIDPEKFPPKSLLYFINNAKEEGLRASAVNANDSYNQKFIELYALYEQQCQREGVLDFAELMLRTYELLSANTPSSQALLNHYQQRFSQILVDEFQDTNRLQYAWLKLFAGEHNAIFAVGDDDQSIYAFRGANVGNMRDFEQEFAIQNLIKLEQNYRSHGHILDAANSLIANNSRRLGKNLHTDQGAGEPIQVFEANSDQQEARWITSEITELVGKGLKRQAIAILYRSNAQSRVIEQSLMAAGIAYRVYGGLRFFERQEIKHLLAYLRLLDNPDDDTAFLRVVNFPTRGIGARSLTQLTDLARLHNCSLFHAIAYLSGKAASVLAQFATLIGRLRAETASLNLPDMVMHLITATGLVAHYEREREGQERIENLQELINAAAAFIREAGYRQDMPARAISAISNNDSPLLESVDNLVVLNETIVEPITPLAGFLSHASLEAGDNQALLGQDAVQLMTVHAAKGLEFHAVFITGLEEGLFPHENSNSELDALEEERRLMYVAITRAREGLYLSYAQSRMLHGQTRYHIRSRFFNEIPASVLKWLLPPSENLLSGRNNKDWQSSEWKGHAEFTHHRENERQVNDIHSLQSTLTQRKFDAANSNDPYQIGQGVFHNKFGEGTVVELEGHGNDKRARVYFYNHGNKWLALSVAKLQLID